MGFKVEGLEGALVATIASGEAVSGVLDLGGAHSIAFVMPSAWTTAALTFQASNASDGTFADVYDDAGTEVSVSAAAARAIPVGTVVKNLAAFRFIKIRSGTTGTPVNQAAARTIQVVLKG